MALSIDDVAHLPAPAGPTAYAIRLLVNWLRVLPPLHAQSSRLPAGLLNGGHDRVGRLDSGISLASLAHRSRHEPITTGTDRAAIVLCPEECGCGVRRSPR